MQWHNMIKKVEEMKQLYAKETKLERKKRKKKEADEKQKQKNTNTTKSATHTYHKYDGSKYGERKYVFPKKIWN